MWDKPPVKNADGDILDDSGERFAAPIAILPTPYTPDDDVTSDETEYSEDQKPFKIESLSLYQPMIPPASKVPLILNHYEALSLADVFTGARKAIGGKDALELWTRLIGLMPTEKCQWGCSVIVRAVKGALPAIAYCRIMNTEIGLGLPFDCSIVAYERFGVWYVLSREHPGLAPQFSLVDSTCSFETMLSLDEIAERVVNAFRVGITNINLEVSERERGELSVGGKKGPAESKFYDGYFEKAYAHYRIRRVDGVRIRIIGVYNLLISTEPSSNGVDWRDFGGDTNEVDSEESLVSDVDWYQAQIAKVLLEGIGPDEMWHVRCATVTF